MMNQNPAVPLKSSAWAALLIGLAGVIHIVITPQHWAHAPAHGLLFAVVGIAEIVWSVMAWRRPSATLYQIGMVAAGWLIILWVITRFLPAPFGHGPERVEPFGVVCKLAEGLGMVAIGVLILGELTSTAGRRAGWRVISLLVIGAFIAGFVTYGVARAAEPMFPGLGASTDEHHDHDETAPESEGEHHDHEETAPESEDEQHDHEETAPEPADEQHDEQHDEMAPTPSY